MYQPADQQIRNDLVQNGFKRTGIDRYEGPEGVSASIIEDMHGNITVNMSAKTDEKGSFVVTGGSTFEEAFFSLKERLS